MTPQEAIIKLRELGWTMPQIAKAVNMARQNVYLAWRGDQMPKYPNAVALIEMAKRGKKPPKVKK